MPGARVVGARAHPLAGAQGRLWIQGKMAVDGWKSQEVPIGGVDYGPVSLGEGGDLSISHQVASGPASRLQ